MTFNKERFLNFARYDLAINRVFYRNLMIITAATSVGITLMGFMMRYLLWKDAIDLYGPSASDDLSYIYNQMPGTAFCLLAFYAAMLCIFAGCWAHNLRNRQGRIIELTLPATNAEKFLWHLGLMLAGGLALCCVSLLLADGINALLTLITYGADGGVTSLFKAVTDLRPFSSSFYQPDDEERMLLNSMEFCIVVGFVVFVATHVLGNALKYKHNIILTYLAWQVLGFIYLIVFFFCVGVLSEHLEYHSLPFDSIQDVAIGLYVLGTFGLLVTGLLGWWSYKKYTQAQITSPLNK